MPRRWRALLRRPELEAALDLSSELIQDDIEALKKTSEIELSWESLPEDSCCICLSHFAEQEKALRLGCSHIFHTSCLEVWLRRNASCPVCKRSAFALVAP